MKNWTTPMRLGAGFAVVLALMLPTTAAGMLQAGQTMDEIVGSIRRVTGIMGEIAAASAEQTRGIEQVNQAITQMDQVTQHNAALVEQAAGAAHSLQQQAAGLTQVVGTFRPAPAQQHPADPHFPRALPALPAAVAVV